MPPLPAPGPIIQVRFHYTLAEDTFAVNRLFYSYTGTAPSAAECSTAALNFAGEFVTQLKPLMSDARICTEISVLDLSSSTGALGTYTTPITGSRTGGGLPADVCLLESHEVLRRFRGGHGRTYWPFGTVTDLFDEQKWDSAFIAACASDLGAFHTAAPTLGWTGTSLSQALISYYEGFTPFKGTTGRYRNISNVRSAPVVDAVVNHTIQPGLASQRRRLLRLA